MTPSIVNSKETHDTMIPRLMYIASRLITIYMVMGDKIGHIEKLISSKIATYTNWKLLG